MKKVILLVLFMPFTAYGQIMENFESGSINNWVQSFEGRWKADTEGALSGKYSLHHSFDNPDAGIDKIGLQVKNLHLSEGITRWTFQVRHGYDPSSSNNWAVFLMSDKDPGSMSLDGGTNGFAIGVNLSGYDDTLRLVKVKGTTQTTIVNCLINWQTAISITESTKIVVERSPVGNYEVSVFKMDGTLLKKTCGTDAEVFSPVWFSVWYKYSSTRDRLLWIDEISVAGVFYEDTEAPYVTEFKESGKSSILITFSEPPVAELLVKDNFELNSPGNKAIGVEQLSPLIINIQFAGTLINRTLNKLTINMLCDKTGNCSLDYVVTFIPVWAERGDVIISEIMADPIPEISLPSKEYLEITNMTNYSFNLRNWKLASGEQKFLFPETVIQPNEIVIICLLTDVSLFSKYGNVTGLKQFPSLSDGGKLICLTDSTDSFIHGVEYSSEWYGDQLKSEGGWSLELIDLNYPFYASGNWAASSSRKGGTPGTVNSIAGNNPDKEFYGIQNAFPDDSANISINFSEPVFTLMKSQSNIKINGNNIVDIYPVDPLFRKYNIKPASFLLQSKIYQIEIPDSITDSAGNSPERKRFSFGLTETARAGDILFNEILFNSLPGEADYIELYNNSDKIIDVSRLQLVSVNDETGYTSQLYQVSAESRCLLPGEYYTITTEKDIVEERYFSCNDESIHEINSLPSMNDDKGHLILYSRELEKIDEVFYDEKMHYSLLSDYEGIALEKTSPGLRSELSVNWHSAAGSAGWGTPGATNSLYVEQPVTYDLVSLSSSKMTPDNDGYEDFLVISFKLTGGSNIISAAVFDETGNFIKKIASNLLAAPETSLIWDGTADDGTPVRTGIYIIFITLYDDAGKAEKWKKVCTVIR